MNQFIRMYIYGTDIRITYKLSENEKITPNCLIDKLKYHSNINNINSFTFYSHTALKSHIIELYLKNFELDLCIEAGNKITCLTNSIYQYELDPITDYIIYRKPVIYKYCIAVSEHGVKCHAPIYNDSINCINHFITNKPTVDLIKCNYVHFKETITMMNPQLLFGEPDTVLIPYYKILEAFNCIDYISLYRLNIQMFENTIMMTPRDIKILEMIKRSFFGYAYTILNSYDYLPNLVKIDKSELTHYMNDSTIINTPESTDIKVNVEKTPSTCSICFDKIESSDDVYKCECKESHIFCNECIITYINTKLNEGCDYKCPFNNKSNIDIRSLYNKLDEPNKKKIRHNSLKEIYTNASIQNANIYMCPFCKLYAMNIITNDIPEENNTISVLLDKFQANTVELLFIDGFEYPFIKSGINAYLFYILISINDIDMKGLSKKNIYEQLSEKTSTYELQLKKDNIGIMIRDTKHPGITIKSNIQNITCKNCWREWCIECNKTSHEGPCNKIHNISDISKVISDLVSDIMIDRCPKCNYGYIKIDGCNLIHCSKCMNAFCHLCKLNIYKKHDREYWHFKNSGSADKDAICPLYMNDAANKIKQSYINSNIKIKNIINENPAYKNKIINELTKHNIYVQNKACIIL